MYDDLFSDFCDYGTTHRTVRSAQTALTVRGDHKVYKIVDGGLTFACTLQELRQGMLQGLGAICCWGNLMEPELTRPTLMQLHVGNEKEVREIKFMALTDSLHQTDSLLLGQLLVAGSVKAHLPFDSYVLDYGTLRKGIQEFSRLCTGYAGKTAVSLAPKTGDMFFATLTRSLSTLEHVKGVDLRHVRKIRDSLQDARNFVVLAS